MAGTNSILGGGGFHHVAIKVKDFDRTVAMYKEAFGFTEKVAWGAKTAERDNRGIMLDTGDGNFLEVFGDGSKTVRPAAAPTECCSALIHWAFRTTKIDEVMERARKAGFKVTVEPKDVTPAGVTARVAFCEGPDGEVFEFFQGEFFKQ
jgi:catechol 2,3-dioxygenase-like lactoylglutathione lyase family enzyme